MNTVGPPASRPRPDGLSNSQIKKGANVMTLRSNLKTLIPILILLALLSVSVTAQATHCSDSLPRNERPSAPSSVFPGMGTGAIPEATGGPANWAAPLNITFNVNGVNGLIRHIVLNISMTHTYVGDLEVVLHSPNAQTGNVVFARVGATSMASFGDNSNLSGTYTFSDFATANPWTVATNQACGTDCVVTPQAYRSTQAGPSTNPAPMTSFRSAFTNTLVPNGTWTLRIRDGGGGDTGFVTAASLSIETFYSRTNFDFDGDDKTDIGIFRPGSAQWWINRSSTGSTFALQFGAATDKLVPADFTGDGRTDVAVWRPSTGEWFVLRSDNFSYYAFPFGTNGDIPAPDDYDDDGRADAAVFRPSNGMWFIQRSSGGGIASQQFGAPGDVPVVGDYDVDGCADMAIYRPSNGEWWINRTRWGVLNVQFGAPGDKPVPGDYSGDGKTDAAVWRPSNGTWYVLRAENMTMYSMTFGASGDIPTPGDYDGDFKADAAVFRPSNSTWYVLRWTGGTMIQQFGAAGDRPIPNAFVP